MTHETLQKFRYPDTLIREYRFWAVLLRPDQVTAGSLILACTQDIQQFSGLPDAGFHELSEVTRDLERTLRLMLNYEKINYLMLMMVDKHVHFHVLPRYSQPRVLGGVTFVDNSWPGPPSLAQAIPTSPSEFARILQEFRANWPA